MKPFFLFFTLTTLSFGTSLEPSLELQGSDGKKVILKRSDLLKHPKLEEIVLPANSDPAHPKLEMKYKAVKLSELFSKLKVNNTDVLQFGCTDGFSAPMFPGTSSIALKGKANTSIAYIAIEQEDGSWPDLSKLHEGKHQGTAGPFYLVWKNPELSGIKREEWPFKLSGLKMVYSIEKSYPLIQPHLENSSDEISKGYKSFVKNCFACHTMNLSGPSELGPDLNMPKNPTEYFNEDMLKQFIRAPQKVRNWKAGRMLGFDEELISNEELDHLVEYLKHMAEKRAIQEQ